MKIILCGKNDTGVECLEHLLAKGDQVWVVGTHGDDGQDGWQRSLVGAARKHGMQLDQPRKINDPEFVKRLSAFGADLLVSVQYDQILRDPLFDSIGCPWSNVRKRPTAS